MIYIFAAAFNMGSGPICKSVPRYCHVPNNSRDYNYFSTDVMLIFLLFASAWIYASEIPSNRMRAYNVALASLTHWIHNLAVTKATPVMLYATPYGAYFIFGSINFLMAVIAFWLPETKGVSVPLPWFLKHIPIQFLCVSLDTN
jgi:hypothetical protein